VLVEYESSSSGRAALFHALSIARDADASLMVVAVARRERVGIGCASCRANTVFWNQEMKALAEDALADARALVGPSPTIDYAVACGSSAKEALVQAATASGADVIVVPSVPHSGLRRRFSSSLAEQLRRDGRWTVVTPANAE
jgi:nucleotide-binding universal stress UspA family protein